MILHCDQTPTYQTNRQHCLLEAARPVEQSGGASLAFSNASESLLPVPNLPGRFRRYEQAEAVLCVDSSRPSGHHTHLISSPRPYTPKTRNFIFCRPASKVAPRRCILHVCVRQTQSVGERSVLAVAIDMPRTARGDRRGASCGEGWRCSRPVLKLRFSPSGDTDAVREMHTQGIRMAPGKLDISGMGRGVGRFSGRRPPSKSSIQCSREQQIKEAANNVEEGPSYLLRRTACLQAHHGEGDGPRTRQRRERFSRGRPTSESSISRSGEQDSTTSTDGIQEGSNYSLRGTEDPRKRSQPFLDAQERPVDCG